MTFKHEYVVQKDNPNLELSHKRHADKCEYEIGQLIGKTFGWEKVAQPSHLISEDERMKLEIEAFPIDKWVEFKNALHIELLAHKPNQIRILELIK